MSPTLPASLPGLRSHNLSTPKNAAAAKPVAQDGHATTASVRTEGPFSAAALERFRAEDAAAGRTICTILTTPFTVCVLLATGVITWHFLFAISPK